MRIQKNESDLNNVFSSSSRSIRCHLFQIITTRCYQNREAERSLSCNYHGKLDFSNTRCDTSGEMAQLRQVRDSFLKIRARKIQLVACGSTENFERKEMPRVYLRYALSRETTSTTINNNYISAGRYAIFFAFPRFFRSRQRRVCRLRSAIARTVCIVRAYTRACITSAPTYVTQLAGLAVPRLGTLSKLRVFDPTGKTHQHSTSCTRRHTVARPMRAMLHSRSASALELRESTQLLFSFFLSFFLTATAFRNRRGKDKVLCMESLR